MNKEKVIIRREYDPFREEWGYLAAFPESPSNPGKILCLPFFFLEDGTAIFDAHCEVDFEYYYKTKIVHAKTDEAKKCCEVITRYYNRYSREPINLRLAEKIIK